MAKQKKNAKNVIMNVKNYGVYRMNIEYYKEKAKKIKKEYKNDYGVQYLCNSIIRSKDYVKSIASLNLLVQYLKNNYDVMIA